MKKKLFSFIAAFVALFAVVSCSDDIESSLDGTVWVVEFSDYGYSEFKFYEIEVCETYHGAGYSFDKTRFAYECDGSLVMLYPNNDDASILKGIISGDKMAIINMSNGKYIWTLTRTK